MSNYILGIDRDGQPYLVHASDSSNKHKYLMKIPNYYYKTGRDLYLYTNAEVKAYIKRGKPNFSNRIRDKLGWDERSERDDAKALYESLSKNNRGTEEQKKIVKASLDKAEENYAKTWLGKREAAKKKHAEDKITEVRANVHVESADQRSKRKTETEMQRIAKKNIEEENKRIRGRKTQRWFESKFK